MIHPSSSFISKNPFSFFRHVSTNSRSAEKGHWKKTWSIITRLHSDSTSPWGVGCFWWVECRSLGTVLFWKGSARKAIYRGKKSHEIFLTYYQKWYNRIIQSVRMLLYFIIDILGTSFSWVDETRAAKYGLASRFAPLCCRGISSAHVRQMQYMQTISHLWVPI